MLVNRTSSIIAIDIVTGVCRNDEGDPKVKQKKSFLRQHAFVFFLSLKKEFLFTYFVK